MSETNEPGGPMIAPCGLNCDACPIRKAERDKAFAEELAAQWRKGGQKDVTAEWFTCQGCAGPDELVWSGDCEIRACCRKKGLSNCSQCDDFPCRLIDAFANDGMGHHARAVAYLRTLHQQGAQP